MMTACRLLSEAGMVPENRFELASRLVTAVSVPKAVGNFPLQFVPATSNDVMLPRHDNRPIASDRVPFKPFGAFNRHEVGRQLEVQLNVQLVPTNATSMRGSRAIAATSLAPMTGALRGDDIGAAHSHQTHT